MKARLLMMICLLLLTTACGFHLRGSQVTDFDISNIYINPSSAPQLAKEVKSQLSGSGATLANSSQDAAYIITLKEERFDKSVLSVSAATGKAGEFQIVYNAKMDAAHADGKNIVENDRISVTRDFTFDENAVLGKFSEEVVVQEDLIRSAASQVLRRLQALLRNSQ
jgi:LPS-assembly lipoprotein